jgi:hypothetical protein
VAASSRTHGVQLVSVGCMKEGHFTRLDRHRKSGLLGISVLSRIHQQIRSPHIADEASDELLKSLFSAATFRWFGRGGGLPQQHQKAAETAEGSLQEERRNPGNGFHRWLRRRR